MLDRGTYKLEISGAGHVDYHGSRYVKISGTASSQLSSDQVARLIVAINKADCTALSKIDFSGEDSLCAAMSGGATTSLRLAGKEYKIMRSDGSCADATILKEFENSIDDIVQIERWIGNDEWREAISFIIEVLRSQEAESSFSDNDMRLLQMYSEMGSAPAQFWLSRSIQEGKLRPLGDGDAIKWLKRSALQGNDAAIIELANLYMSGKILTLNNQEAFFWFSVAHRRVQENEDIEKKLTTLKSVLTPQEVSNVENRADEWYSVPEMLPAPEIESLLTKWLRGAAESGDDKAQLSIGIFYTRNQVFSLEEDYAEAEKWFIKSAEQNNHEAQLKLMYLYEGMGGFKYDKKERYFWCGVSVLPRNDAKGLKYCLREKQGLDAADIEKVDQRIMKWISEHKSTKMIPSISETAK